MEKVNIERLIQKMLAGHATAAEQTTINDWRQRSDANEQDFHDMKDAWEAAGQFTTPTWDIQSALEKVQARIEGDEASSKQNDAKIRVNRTYSIRRIAIAASVIALVAIGGLFALQLVNQPAQMIAEAEMNDKSIELIDGSRVHLNQGSALTYPETFETDERVVKLVGEAFFNIKKDAARPFVIETDRVAVTVLGTSFVVDASQEKDGMTKIYVMEGRVRFQPINSEKFIELAAGEHAYFNGNELSRQRNADLNEIAWHTRQLSYLNEPVSRLIEDLKEVYGVDVDLSQSNIKDCSFTSPLPFNDSPIEEIFEALKISFSIQVESNGNKSYQLIGGRCE